MKPSLLNSYIHFFLYGAIIVIVAACNNRWESSEDQLPFLYSQPQSILLNTKQGYVLNAFTGDSIKPIINSNGDTVATGRPIFIYPQPITAEIIAHPKVAPLIISPASKAQPNRHLVNTIDPVKIDNTQLKKRIIGIDSTKDVLINSIGDTITTGKIISLQGKRVSCRYSSPIHSPSKRMKENAGYDLKYLDEDEGLNSPYIAKIYQDSRGDLWIGGDKGVSRYDGISFTHFTTEQGLCNNSIQSIIEDHRGILWIGTRGGLSRFDGDSFIQYTEKEGLGNHLIFAILEDREAECFWLGTFGGGVCKFTPSMDGETAEIIHYTKKEGLSNNRVSSLIKLSSGEIWCGTSGGGANLFDPPQKSKRGSFTHFTKLNGLPDNWVISMTQDDNHNMWFATLGGACQLVSPLNSKELLCNYLNTSKGLSDNMTWTVLEDIDHDIWISTQSGGVNRYSLQTDKRHNSASIEILNEDNGLTHNYIWEVFEDQSNLLWFGSIGGGVIEYNPRSFRHYTKKEGLCGNDIECFTEDNFGNIWFGDNGMGFCRYQPDSESSEATFTNFRLDSLYDGGNNRNRIHSLFQDKKGTLWFATRGGIFNCRLTEEGNPTAFTFFQLRLPRTANLYNSCLEDYSGSIWFGSSGGGITRFIPSPSDSNYTFVQYTEKEGLSSNYISSLKEDENHYIWIGSQGGGVSCYIPSEDGKQDSIIHFTEKEGLPDNEINCMYRMPNGNMWFGTSEQGLFQFSSTGLDSTIQITSISEKEGLVHNLVWSLTAKPNQSERLWAGTKKGIYIIEINQDGNQKYTIQELSKADGLKRTDFDANSVLMDSKNNIWWGTGKGIEFINSNTFYLSDKIPEPRMRGIEINGTFIDFHNLNTTSKQEIFFDSIARFENYPIRPSFPHNKNHLTFLFSASDWAAPHKIRYSYLMKGLQDSWSLPSSETRQDYRNLPSGTHTFKVRAIGESQKWSDPFEYTFTIRPPWWYSWWAFVMYSCLGGFVLYRTYRFQLDRKLAMADRKRLVELDQVKNRLYTNITHEFRTPLTLIHGPVTQALSRNSTLEQKDIQSIHRQSERLQELINQMLELQKLEAGMLKPNYAYGEIIQMLRYLFGSFESWAREKNISMIFSSSLQEVYMDFDKEKLTQIITNLVTNAIKHTPRSGKIALSINASPSGESLLIQVADTGVGINSEDLPFVFDRFYQSKRAAVGGTGIGLAIVKNLTELLGGSITVESEPDKGTTFKLKLPITKHAPVSATSPQVVTPMMQENEDEESRFVTKDSTIPGKPLVLVIEDHPEVSQYIVSCLSSDFNTLTAMNGDEGLQVALEKVPDLIISDVMMPGKDGFELCRILKSDIQTSHIPIILLTGRSDHEAMMAGIEHGADAYVVKPFDPDELILRAKKLLELRTSLSLHYRQHATLKELEPSVSASVVENEFLKKLRSFIEEHINDMRFNMDMLCHQMAMSHAQLHRKVTALTGESVGKFVRAIRLSRAKELLKKSDLTISEIAYETGFSEPGYFTKVFSKEFNMSPSEFRDNPT